MPHHVKVRRIAGDIWPFEGAVKVQMCESSPFSSWTFALTAKCLLPCIVNVLSGVLSARRFGTSSPDGRIYRSGNTSLSPNRKRFYCVSYFRNAHILTPVHQPKLVGRWTWAWVQGHFVSFSATSADMAIGSGSLNVMSVFATRCFCRALDVIPQTILRDASALACYRNYSDLRLGNFNDELLIELTFQVATIEEQVALHYLMMLGVEAVIQIVYCILVRQRVRLLQCKLSSWKHLHGVRT